MAKTETKTVDLDAKAKADALAANGTKNVVKPETGALAIFDPKADEGWQILDSGEGRCYWYLDPDADPKDRHANVITGVAMGVDSFDILDDRSGEMRTRKFIKVQLTAPAMTVDAENKDERGRAIPKLSPKGTLVWVGIRHAMEDLFNKVRRSTFLLEVLMRANERVSLGSGQTVWRIAQAAKVTKRPRIIEHEDERAPKTEDSDVPF